MTTQTEPEEFNLSEKMGFVENYQIVPKEQTHISHRIGVFELEDVKEFIRLLKEKGKITPRGESNTYILSEEEIDKLVGEKK